MADERRIVIELRIGEGAAGESDDKAVDDGGENLTKFLKMAQHPIRALEKAVFGKTEWLYYTYQQAKSITKTTVLYGLERYYNLTENYKSEQMLRNTLNVLTNASDFGTSVLGGAIVGAAGGPVGAMVGAVVGTISWTANATFNAWKAYDQQNISLKTMNVQSGYQKVRLGLIDDGRGTQN